MIRNHCKPPRIIAFDRRVAQKRGATATTITPSLCSAIAPTYVPCEAVDLAGQRSDQR